MADIPYQCPKCNNTRMVSEFADPSKITCSNCACTMIQPGAIPVETPKTETSPSAAPTTAPPATQKNNKLKLARANQPEPAPDEPIGVVTSKKNLEPEIVRAPLELHPKKKAKKKIISQPVIAFLIFVVVGGASWILRNGGIFPMEQIEPWIEYAWVGVLLLHIWITLKALTIDMMQGIMCIFIPGWSFVYLAISDQFYQKAIVFGLLFGIGYDGGMQLLAIAGERLGAIQEFINTGGGDVRRR